MARQLFVVLRLYLYSWSNWLLAAVGLAIIVLTLSLHRSHFRVTTPHKSFWTETTFESKSDPRTWSRSGDANAEAVRCFYGPEIPWGEFKQLPNLTQLRLRHYRHYTGDEGVPEVSAGVQMRRVAELTATTYLSLPRGDYTESDVDPWSALQSLEWLATNRANFLGGLKSLPVFPKLHTLELRLQDLNEASFEYLSELPALSTLILRDGKNPEFGRTKLSAIYPVEVSESVRATLAKLGDLPTLERVYLPGREFGDLELLVASAAPQLDVRPEMVNDSYFGKLFFSLLGVGVLWLVVGFGTFGHFSREASVLTPNYARAHLLVSLAWVAVTGSVLVVVLSWFGVHWVVAAASATFTAGCLLNLVKWKLPLWQRISLGCGWMLLFILQVSRHALIVTRKFVLGEVTWWLTAALFLCGCAGIYVWIRRSTGLHRELASNGISFPILTLKDFGRLAEVLTGRKRNPAKRGLASWIKTTPHVMTPRVPFGAQEWSRSRLMAWPSSQITKGLMQLLLVIYVLVYVVQWIVSRGNDPASIFHETFHIFGQTYIVFFSIACVHLNWAPRRLMFAQELLRPITRQDFVDELFSTTRHQVLWLPLAVVGISAVFLFSRFGLSVETTALWLAELAYIAGVSIFVYGCGMYSLSLQREWAMGLVGLASFLSIVASAIIIEFASRDVSGLIRIAPATLAYLGLLFIACGAVLTTLAKLRWTQLEFGMLRP